MDPVTFARVQDVFEAVCDLAPEVRRRHLDQLCERGGAIRAQVEAMLATDLQDDGIFDRPLAPGIRARLIDDLGHDPLVTLPEVIGEFRVLRQLGEGGMGVVYEAEQEHPRRLVAVKCVHPWLQSEALRDRFHDEAQLMGLLLHPNIPQIYEAGQDHGRLYLAMERVEGVPLEDFAKNLTIRQRIRLLDTICDAVHHAHARGVIHCDLKPSNILVTAEGQPKVLDFGIASAWRHGEGDGRRADVMGTPQAMSPQQLRGGTQPSPSWDVFALGAIGWQLLTGTPPFVFDNPRDREAAIKTIERGPPRTGVPRGLLAHDACAVMRRAVHADQDYRYPSVAELRSDLARTLAHRPVTARPRSPGYLLEGWFARNRRPIRWIAGPVVIAAVLAVGFEGARSWLAHLEHHRREVDATAHWTVTQQRMQALQADSLSDRADTLFRAFAEAPSSRGTRTVHEAWGERAANLAHAERWTEEVHALAHAYSTAPDLDAEVRALTSLAEVFDRRWQWTALGAALDRLRRRGAPHVALETKHAIVTRNLPRALVLLDQDDPRRPVVQALMGATAFPLRAGRTWASDLDGDGKDEIFGPIHSGLDVLTGEGRHTTIDLPYSDIIAATWLPTHHVLLAQHAPFDGRRLLRVYTPRPEHLGSRIAQADWTLDEPALLSATEADIDGDGKPEVYVGTGPYTRRLLRLDRDQGAWRASSPHAGTDASNSDIPVITSADLDQDGQEELLLAATWWQAWDLRLFHADHDKLSLVHRERLGVVRPLLPIQTAAGPRLLAGTLQPGTPGPAMARLYRLEGADLIEETAWPLEHPVPAIQPHFEVSYLADIDGDGLQDVATTVSYDGQRHGMILRQLPGGGFVSVVLGAGRVVGAHDIDNDGSDELFFWMSDTDEAWVFGSGTAQATVLQTPNEHRNNVDDGLSVARDLAAVGLLHAAAQHAESEAPFLNNPAEGLLLAASIREDLHDHATALTLYDQAKGAAPQQAGRGRARTLASLGRYAEAVDVWQQLGGPDADSALHWLRPLLVPPPTVSANPTRALHPSWRIVEPMSFRRVPEQAVLRVDVYKEAGGDIAVLPLERHGDLVELAVDLSLRDAEMGSGLALQLRQDGKPLWWWYTAIHGGAGVTRRSMATGTGAAGLGLAEPDPSITIDPERYVEQLQLRMRHIPATGATEVHVTSDLGGELHRDLVLPGLHEGPIELVVSHPDHGSYGSPMHLRADISQLKLTGFQWTAQPASPRQMLANADAAGALHQLDEQDHTARAVALVDMGRLDQAADVVATALREHHPRAHALLRATDPLLAERLLDRLGDRWHDEWFLAYQACLQHPDHLRCAAALGTASHGETPVETTGQRTLLWRHAIQARSRGQLDLAEHDLERLVSHATPADGRIYQEALFSWAEIAHDRGDYALADQRLERAVQSAVATEIARDRAHQISQRWSALP